MSPFEIALVIIGIVCIVASCFFIDYRKEDTVNTEIGSVTEQILFAKLSEINDQLSVHMSDLKNSILEETKEDLDRLSNEKIMAVHEYSEQVLSDIKKNHNEVMFLYQMLTDKEEVLKKSLDEYRDIIKKCTSESTMMEKADQVVTKIEHDIYESKNHRVEKNKEEEHFTKALQEIEKQEFASHIDEIIELAEEGHSIIDISKRLGLGQGEVKLVLDYDMKRKRFGDA